MPYARRARTRNYRPRRGGMRARGSRRVRSNYTVMGSAGFLAKKALQGVNYIRGLVNSELYKVDGSINIPAYSTPSITLLTGVAQGDGDGARTGNSIMVKSCDIRSTCVRSSSDTVAVTRVCAAVVEDMQQASDTSPTFLDIFESVDPQTHLNSNTVGRYNILKRWNFILDSVKSQAFTINFPIYRHVHHCRFNGANASDTQKGHFYLVLWSDHSVTNAPSFYGEWRLNYHDN